MAAQADKRLSTDFLAAAAEERARLLKRVRALRAELERLSSQAEALEAELAVDERLLRELEDVLDLAPQLRLDLQDADLRGQRLREVALDVLRREVGVGQPIHYRAWFRLVRAEGHRVAGKDPVATFLTQVTRTRDVEPVGARSGLYRLREAA